MACSVQPRLRLVFYGLHNVVELITVTTLKLTTTLPTTITGNELNVQLKVMTANQKPLVYEIYEQTKRPTKDEERYLFNFVFVPVFQHFLINECVTFPKLTKFLRALRMH